MGSLHTFAQSKLKRFLALSSVYHTGFMLLSLITKWPLNFVNIEYYLLIYIFTLIGIFILLNLTFLNNYTKREFIYLSDFKYLKHSHIGLKIS